MKAAKNQSIYDAAIEQGIDNAIKRLDRAARLCRLRREKESEAALERWRAGMQRAAR